MQTHILLKHVCRYIGKVAVLMFCYDWLHCCQNPQNALSLRQADLMILGCMCLGVIIDMRGK